MLRRRSLAAALAAPAAAQDYPTRTIRLVVPRAPGGGSDNIARVLAAPLGARLGQTVVVENRPDATAILGAELVARAAPDGYTLYLADNSFYQNPSFIPHIPYNTIRDFAAVTMLAQAPVVLLANPAVPARTVAELVAYAKANRGSSATPRAASAPRRTSPVCCSTCAPGRRSCTCRSAHPAPR